MSIRGSQQASSAARAARRRWLMQAGALTYSATLPIWVPRAAAQSQSTLNALPRIALIIGNTKYLEAPLKNPGNDAKAIAAELQKVGFKVNLQLDTGRAQLADAIQAYGADLAKTKGVGLFYYAGHGAQLGWRNYLIPVDAEIEKLDDIKTKTVELNTLLAGLTKAQNAMNVIILDACRDNPFGTRVPTEQKGLSQFDAPPGSLLAYATSPGNTAGDGTAANGLFTENLLREIKVPEAKIEDVLKRVRLNVRRKSEGQQIPWESTSLEEDFYFLPPAQIKKLSEAELERKFKDELAIWESLKESKESGPLEDYLKRYPSGNFSELAQLRLEWVLARQGERRIHVPSQANNPFTKGSAFTRIAKVGDSFTYRDLNLSTKVERGTYTTVVTEVNETVAIHDNGLVTDLIGNQLQSRGSVNTPAQLVPQEFAIGKRWQTRYDTTNSKGVTFQSEQSIRVVTREEVTVPAGTFNAFLLEGIGRNSNPTGPTEFKVRRWYVPEFQRPVVREQISRRDNKVIFSQRLELLSYKLA